MTLRLSTRLAAPADDRHPFWAFEWEEATQAHTIVCVCVLMLAALLCSAGGIGGGGVFVSVLMVVGRLSPRDAVPLSKAVVFFGSMSSLALNMGVSLKTNSSRPKSLIDYSICRLVVPGALTGTLLGVVINSSAADTIIVIILVVILLGMSASAIWTTYTQFLEEEAEAAGTLLQRAGGGADATDLPGTPNVAKDFLKDDTEAATAQGRDAAFEALAVKTGASPVQGQQHIERIEVCAAVAMLVTVVINGVVRHHASACLWEIENGVDPTARSAACQHPTLYPFVKGRLEDLMGNPKGASWALLLTLALPIFVCSAAMLHSSHALVRKDHWELSQVLMYGVMSVATGILAGLIGIGGGLIFAPFFLFMGVEPAIAVATSSTCVIFTSSSTTLQYILTDRVIMSLALVYGAVNLVGSYGGTSFVHYLQGRFATRRSYISAIVTVGVVISALLSLAKLVMPAH